jgi:hypothetical protein
MPLVRPLSEGRRATLVGHLNRAERRLVTPHEDGLQIVAVDGRIGLEEDAQEEILGEELVGADDVDPRALGLGVWRALVAEEYPPRTGR